MIIDDSENTHRTSAAVNVDSMEEQRTQLIRSHAVPPSNVNMTHWIFSAEANLIGAQGPFRID